MERTETLLALRIATELLALVGRAVAQGRDVTHEEIEAAFHLADAAEAEWHKANGEARSDG